jgi:hypothetical protein
MLLANAVANGAPPPCGKVRAVVNSLHLDLALVILLGDDRFAA